MHAVRHTSRGVYTMFWTLTQFNESNEIKNVLKNIFEPFSWGFVRKDRKKSSTFALSN